MLINEVLSEGQGYVLNGVEELIVRAKARGLTKLNTSSLHAKLQAGGYIIDMKSLVRLLNTITAVGSANKDEIKLDTALPSGADPTDDTVSKMASKQLTKKDKKL
jgi:hypothetical protein|tara:strand:+ start:30 stop:344 length:315 start_codon:yes stop_codon:yes gene_type:complete